MIFPLDLNVIWFLLIGVLLTGYAILDGFDLGVGAVHLFFKQDSERRTFLNAIGPIWDGNKVWLVTSGGALFAAFPEVYATVFSGFYLAFILLLFALIFRAVSIEFRSKQAAKGWRSFWDVCFGVSSILASFIFGIAVGNIARGVPLDVNGEFQGNFLTLIHPYSLLVGVTVVLLFAMHGALYLLLKTEGALYQTLRRKILVPIGLFIVCYAVTSLITVTSIPHMVAWTKESPFLLVLPFIHLVVIIGIFYQVSKGRDFVAFIFSCLNIVCLMALLGLGLFPNLVFSNPGPANSLTIYNAASSLKTLSIMLWVASIGMPLVIVYTVIVYRIFRGKVKLDSSGY